MIGQPIPEHCPDCGRIRSQGEAHKQGCPSAVFEAACSGDAKALARLRLIVAKMIKDAVPADGAKLQAIVDRGGVIVAFDYAQGDQRFERR